MDADELLQQYAAGRRDFAGAVLCYAHLARANLGEANLQGSDLRKAVGRIG
jgi:uncharacterized protein YjbI with pentapeptide repeats